MIKFVSILCNIKAHDWTEKSNSFFSLQEAKEVIKYNIIFNLIIKKLYVQFLSWNSYIILFPLYFYYSIVNL